MRNSMDLLRWDDFRYFISVAATSSLRISAELLGISAATLSRHICALEKNLNTVLFIRKTSGLSLTQDGVKLFEQCKKIQTIVKDIKNENEDALLEQEVRLACIPCMAYFKIIPSLEALKADIPHLKLILSTSPELSEMSNDNIDIAIRLSRPQTGRYLVRRIAQYNLFAYQSRRHQFELGVTPLILWGSFNGYSSRVNDVLTDRFKNHPVALLSNNLFNIIQAIHTGLGVGYLPDYVAQQYPDLIRVGDEASLPQHENVWMIIREEAQRRPCVRKLADHIADKATKLMS